jgi:hypothetical protein
MWTRSPRVTVALVGGAVASLFVIAVAPVWVGFAIAVVGASGWCFLLELEEREQTRGALALMTKHVAAHETVYVFGRTPAGTARAINEVRRLVGERPMELAVFVLHHARRGAPAPVATVTAIRRIAEARGATPRVMAYACRGPNDVTPWLVPESAVVIERSGPTWWPTFSRRLAAALRRAGCRVAVA